LNSGAAEFSETQAPTQGLIAARAAHSRGFRIATTATGSGLCTSACFLIFVCGDLAAPDKRAATDAGPQKNAAADRIEKIYNGVAVGTDAEGNEGYNAAQQAEDQLRLDFLSSFQNPRKNAANQTAWDQEAGQLISDSLKYGGDRTLDAAAMYWGGNPSSFACNQPARTAYPGKNHAALRSTGRKRVQRVHGQLPGRSFRFAQQVSYLPSFCDR